MQAIQLYCRPSRIRIETSFSYLKPWICSTRYYQIITSATNLQSMQNNNTDQTHHITKGPSPKNNEESRDPSWVPKKLNWTVLFPLGRLFSTTRTYTQIQNCTSVGIGIQSALMKCNKCVLLSLIDKDLTRTRASEEYFKKQSTRQLLKRIVTFYCLSNKIQYQQGLLEVVVPFALLHRPDFPTRKCYAYFNAFMRKLFPKVLVQKTMANKNELPHTILAITLSQILLRYHQRQIYQVFKENEVPLSMVVTQQIMTVFARNLPIPLVYQIFDYYINKQDEHYLLYLTVALISVKGKDIFKAAQQDQLHNYVNKNLKDIKDRDDLDSWFHRAQQIEAATPNNFIQLCLKTGYKDRSFYTNEDYQRMMKLENWLIDYIMPVYRDQVQQNPEAYVFLLLEGQPPLSNVHCLRLSYKQSSGNIMFNEEEVLQLGRQKVLVVGYTQQKEAAEKPKLTNIIREIETASNFGYRFMIFQDKLKVQKTCDIY